MIRFNEYLSEAVKASGGKNVHLEHLEDEILNNGYAGFKKAIQSVRGVMDALAANAPSSHEITVKWDGAPAIICGTDPSTGKFFVGTKSVFNVTPKLNFTPADIDANHPSPGLNEKLKLALQYLPKLGIKGVLQGDLMFDKSSLLRTKIDGKTVLTFTPNTITYAVDPASALGKRISSAKMGIVFHTAYEGNSLATATAKFNPDLSGLRQTRDVWFDNATLRVADGSGLFSAEERESVEAAIAVLESTAAQLKSVMTAISKNVGVRDAIKMYVNSLVAQGTLTSHADVNDMLAFLGAKAQAKRKTKMTKPTPSMDWIKRNRNQIARVFALHNQLAHLKLVVVKKLASLSGKIGTFIRDGKGYRVTSPEGFVAIDRMSNQAVKLVDRLDFSRSNFTVPKTWSKD